MCIALGLALPACAGPAASGPGPSDGHGASAAPARQDAAGGTAKEVDHFLSATPLLSKVGPEVADQYRKAMEKQKEVAGLKALVASEQAGLDHASGDEKAKSVHRLADLKRMAEAGEKSETQLEQRLVATAKDRSRRVTPRVRATLGPFLTNLRRSVSEALAADEGDDVLSLEATVLDALLDGFTKAGFRPDAEVKVAAVSEPSHTAHRASVSIPRRSRGADQAVASARGDASAKATASQEVFEP
jgi:hypothetical protein